VKALGEAFSHFEKAGGGSFGGTGLSQAKRSKGKSAGLLVGVLKGAWGSLTGRPAARNLSRGKILAESWGTLR